MTDHPNRSAGSGDEPRDWFGDLNSRLAKGLLAPLEPPAENEPVAWLVTWTTKNNGPTASAYIRERDARDAARNVERYADASNVVVAPAYTATVAQSVGMREALEEIQKIGGPMVARIARDALASQPSAATAETRCDNCRIILKPNEGAPLCERCRENYPALARCSAGTGGAVAELKEALRLTRRALKEEMDHITETLEAVSGVEPQALAMQKALEEIQKIGGPMVSRIARDALAVTRPQRPSEPAPGASTPAQRPRG